MGAGRTGKLSNRPRRWVQRVKRYPLWSRVLLATLICGGIIYATFTLIRNGNFLGTDQTVNNQFILSTAIGIFSIVISIFLYFIPLPESKNESPISPPPSSSTKDPSLIWHVPYPHDPYFMDSTDILKNLHEKFNENKTGSLTQPKTISGMGGLGKTATAIEYAYRYSSDYHAVLWANADTREALISDFISIADRLNLPEKDDKDQSRVANAVKRWLGENDGWLLILDNADEKEMVNEFIPSACKGHILLTTHSAGIGKLDGVEVKKMELEDGALFLLRRAKKIASGALLEQASVNDVLMAKEIVKEMDGLPLALDQVGAYIDATRCSLTFYLEHYRKEQAELLKLRSGPNRNHPVDPDPVHPDPVASTWSLSFKKVKRANRAAANLLRLFAFLFPDAIPEEIIKGRTPALGWTLLLVAVEPLKLEAAIGELNKYSLVHRNSNQTLTMHRLVQIALRNSMGNRAQRQWARRTVRAVNQAFPNPEFKNWPECQRFLPQALVCATLIEEYTFEFAEASLLLNQTARYLDTRGLYTQAEPLYKRALSIREKQLGPDHPDTTISLNNLAVLYNRQGKYEQAEPLYKRALSIREKQLGPGHPDTATSLNNLAALYEAQGKYEQAEPLYKRALSIREKQLGPDHPDTATSLNNLAALSLRQGKYTEAESLIQRALSIQEKQLGPDDPLLGTYLNNLAELYQRQGKYTEAESLYQRALAIHEQHLGPQHPDTAISLNNLAGLYNRQGKFDQAEPLYQRALAIREQKLGPQHPDTATSLNNLALHYHVQGKYEQAEPLYQRALAILEKQPRPEHPDTMIARENYNALVRDMKQKGIGQH